MVPLLKDGSSKALFWLQAWLLRREAGGAMRVTWADLCVRDGRWRGYTTLAARVYCSRISAEQDCCRAFVIHVQSVEQHAT